MEKRLNIPKAKRKLFSQIRHLTVTTLITLVLSYLAIICVQYIVLTINCNFAEAAGKETYHASGGRTRNHWDDPDIVEHYENALEAKKAFIQSNLVATFISSLNGKWFYKVLQLVLVVLILVFALLSCFLEIFTIIFIVPSAFKRYLRIRKATKEKNSKNGKGNGSGSGRRRNVFQFILSAIHKIQHRLHLCSATPSCK